VYLNFKTLKSIVILHLFFVLIKGGDITQMLSSVLTGQEICSIQSKFSTALTKFGRIFNEAKQKKKKKFIYPIKSSGLNRSEAVALGYNVSKYMWQTCLNTTSHKKGF